MFYFDIIKALEKAHIRYLIVGGLAVNLHGVPRVTQDIDLIIATDRDNIENICQVFKQLDYVPRLPVNPLDIATPEIRQDWIENRNLTAFSFYHRQQNYRVVDIVLSHPLDFDVAFANKTILEIQEVTLFLVSIEDLIQMKRYAGRQRDLTDIAMLEKAKQIEEDDAG